MREDKKIRILIFTVFIAFFILRFTSVDFIIYVNLIVFTDLIFFCKFLGNENGKLFVQF